MYRTQSHRNQHGGEDILLLAEDTEAQDNIRRGCKRRRCNLDKLVKINSRICLGLILAFLFFTLMTSVSNVTEVVLNEADRELLFMRENPFLDTYVRPYNQSCLLCHTHLPQQCRDLSDRAENKRLLVYIITTAPQNRESREVIRATWAPLANPRPIFLTGYSSDLGVMERLVAEAHLYDDIIVEDFLDSYRNLTIKTAFMMKQFLALCPEADYLIKTDDDMFLQPDLMENILATTNYTDHLIGTVQTGASPYREPWIKYYVPYWLFNETVLPQFVSGWTYVVPGKRVQEIFETSLAVPMINLEDVYFTGLVAGRTLNMTLVNDERFRARPFKGRNVCLYKPLAAFHRLNPKRLLNVWPRVRNLTTSICDTVVKREKLRELAEAEKEKLEQEKKSKGTVPTTS